MAGNVTTLTDGSFDEEIGSASEAVLVDFWAEWCGPCRVVAPVVEEIAKERGEDLVVGKLDVDKHGDVAQRYNVQGIPFLGLFEHGRLARHAVGAMPKAQLERALGLA